MPRQKILIIDDDDDLVGMLKRILETAGYEVFAAYDGSSALKRLDRPDIDLVILDLMMPGMDGWQVMRMLRHRSHTPVLILSARDQLNDLVRGLDDGADDYLVKPFEKHELLARVKARLRRPSAEGSLHASGLPLHDDGRLRIDPQGMLVYVGQELVDLSPTELNLLLLLFENRGRTVGYERILETVWGAAYIDSPQYVHVYVARIHRKLRGHGIEESLLVNERGFGYRFFYS